MKQKYPIYASLHFISQEAAVHKYHYLLVAVLLFAPFITGLMKPKTGFYSSPYTSSLAVLRQVWSR
jgi:hypothetical protein